MTRYAFEVTLLDDGIFSEASAIAGSHTSLDYIPGSNILGWVAGQLYTSLSAEDAFTVFHSGKVRFGNALPTFGGEGVVAPIPLSFHQEKLDPGTIANLAFPGAPTLGQPRHLRGGYVDARWVRCPALPRRSVSKVSLARRHLAREPVEASTVKNLLFSYETIAAGTRFRFVLEADPEVASALVDQVRDVLTGACARFGRSRNAEFGRCTVHLLEKAPSMPSPGSIGGEVHLLLLSDVALRDMRGGQPTLTPTGEAFGMPGATFEAARSFLRVRRYSPFNGTRRRPDLERHVIVQGSVLVFTGCGAVDLQALQKALDPGVGDYREQGLGRVAVNPPWLRKASPVWSSPKPASTHGATPPTDPTDPLLAFIGRRATATAARHEAFGLSRTWADALLRFARHPKGPGRAQWGTLRQLAMQASSGEGLYEELFDRERGFVRSGVRAYAWAERLGGQTAADRFEALAKALRDKAMLPMVVELTAARVARLMNQLEEGGER